jgi:hypothetical protein
LRLSQAPGTLGIPRYTNTYSFTQEEVPVAAAQPTPLPAPAGPVERLAAAAGELASRDLDQLADQQLQADLKALEQVRRRTEAHQIALANTLKTRQARRLTDRGVEAGKAARQADRATRQELTNELHWSPSDARRATRLGGELTAAGTSSQAREQFNSGELSPRHAKLLADTLRHLTGDERDWAETVLLEAAGREDPVTFGRTCRRLLAQLDHDAAMGDEQRRHARRTGRMTPTDDGMLAIHALLSGLDAETVATAIHAFRRPDAPGITRTPEQATADAIVDMAAAALRAAEAPAKHGIRPHVTVDLDYEALLRQAGVAETVWMGPLPFAEIRRLLADCGVSRLLVDPDSTPVEAGPETRDVPNGLYRGLLRRDGGCIGIGCDAPAAWCDVMHLDHPYRFQGRLSLSNAALGCKLHHRRYDLAGWQITWQHGRPTLHPPGRPPQPPGAPGGGTPTPPTDPPAPPESTPSDETPSTRSKPRASDPCEPPSRTRGSDPPNPPARGDDSHVGRLFRQPRIIDDEPGDAPGR